jgi:predicted dehydrogenase
MKVLFCGLGAIGQRHAKILQEKYNFELFAFRSGANNKKNSLGIEELFSWEEVEKLMPSVVFVTNPTSLHIETAIKCAQLGCKLFIEKPIGSNLKDLDKLIDIIQKNKITTFVAYPLRFHPVIIKLKKYFAKHSFLHLRAVCTSYYPLWRPNQNHLERYSANKNLGGGVILDLSHEIDYVSYLLGDITKVGGEFSRRSNITVDTEDWADILLDTDLGPANIHINFLSHLRQRSIQIDFEDMTVVGDIIAPEIREYKKEKLVKTMLMEIPSNYMYEKQIEYFFKNLNNPAMINNLIDAGKIYRKIIKFKQTE